MTSVNSNSCDWCAKRFKTQTFHNSTFGMFNPFSKTFCSPRCRSAFNNQKRRDDSHKQRANKIKETTKVREPKEQKQIREPNKYVEESGFIQQEKIYDNKKTKEDIDLEFYEKQKQIEIFKLEQDFQKEQFKELEKQKQIKNLKAKEYLDNGGNKYFYYGKLLWTFLDKPWKKIVFVFIIWSIIAGIIGEIQKLFK